MSRTILVVDDDAGMRFTITSILEDAGYAVVTAGDGLDALARLADRRPDLIVLDVGMPRMDGFAFAEELARRGLRPSVPIMVLTADGRAPEKAARIGAERYLTKPFNVSALIDIVGRLAGAGAA